MESRFLGSLPELLAKASDDADHTRRLPCLAEIYG